MTLYELLGVSRGVSPDDLKAAMAGAAKGGR